ncbi:hypothetical protein W823_25080 [Williamsia sp. D3]|nr:hypothetical protein W823_25080 [Williamsia sp. D3]
MMWRAILDKPFVPTHIGVTVTFITSTDRSLITAGQRQILAKNLL